MKLNPSLILSTLLIGLATAQSFNDPSNHGGDDDDYSIDNNHSFEYATEHSTEYPESYSSPTTSADIPTASGGFYPSSAATGYANHTASHHHHSSSSHHHNTTATSVRHGSSTSGGNHPSTTQLPSTPTSINGAVRSQFGLAVFGLAVAAGLGL